MKKIIFIALVITMVFAMAIPAMANPGQNPNKNPGAPEVVEGGVTISVTGGGNNLVIRATCNTTGESVVIPRAGNGTFNQSFEAFGYDVNIQVQGNSLKTATANAIAPPPHVCNFTASSVTAPTCHTGGFTTYSCACGESRVDNVIPALGCDYATTTVAATCTANGSITVACTRCVCCVTVTVLPALGHDYVGVITVQPNPGNEGKKVCTCTRCGDSYETVLPRLNNKGNGTDNGTGEQNNACSTNAENPRDEICFCCNPPGSDVCDH